MSVLPVPGSAQLVLCSHPAPSMVCLPCSPNRSPMLCLSLYPDESPLPLISCLSQQSPFITIERKPTRSRTTCLSLSVSHNNRYRTYNLVSSDLPSAAFTPGLLSLVSSLGQSLTSTNTCMSNWLISLLFLQSLLYRKINCLQLTVTISTMIMNGNEITKNKQSIITFNLTH